MHKLNPTVLFCFLYPNSLFVTPLPSAPWVHHRTRNLLKALAVPRSERCVRCHHNPRNHRVAQFGWPASPLGFSETFRGQLRSLAIENSNPAINNTIKQKFESFRLL